MIILKKFYLKMCNVIYVKKRIMLHSDVYRAEILSCLRCVFVSHVRGAFQKE